MVKTADYRRALEEREREIRALEDQIEKLRRELSEARDLIRALTNRRRPR